MRTWRDRYDRREFKLIDWERLEPEEQRELLEMLRRDVSKIYDENGMERVERHMRSDDEVAEKSRGPENGTGAETAQALVAAG